MKAMDGGGMTRDWKIQGILTILIIYFYIFMEWLFFVTKPSFMTTLSLVEKLQMLWVSPLPVIIIGVTGLFLFWIAAVGGRNRIFQTLCQGVAQLIPASILAASIFLLIDNFTYTIAGFGVIKTEGGWILCYSALALTLVAFSYRYLNRLRRRLVQSAIYRKLVLIVVILSSMSIFASFVSYSSSGFVGSKDETDTSPLLDKPNILILTTDGLSAENMGVYGYHRDTTPFMNDFVKNALFCENCFNNAGPSGASITSMYTGKLPTRTRLVFPPDILKGKDAYQHLPGILKRHGYRNIQISMRHYIDPYDLNIRDSFDTANYRKIQEKNVSESLSSIFGQESSYFLVIMYDRIKDRLFHSFGIRKMVDAYAEVVQSEKKSYGNPMRLDPKRIHELFSFIDESSSPFFAHLHLLGTHGPRFYPYKRVYSAGQKQEKGYMRDFYDDAILHFDHQVEWIIQGLKYRGILNYTVLVIGTDHGMLHTVNNRIPLMFFFPKGKHSRRIISNVQYLDIAPTILDYLGIRKPDWMEGQSLISSEVDPNRFIVSVDCKLDARVYDGRFWSMGNNKVGPPFYSLGTVGVIYYHKFYQLDLESGSMTVSYIKDHTSPCNDTDAPDPVKIGEFIINHLSENGYDTSAIKVCLARP
ncbi:MAG: hypothetical protein BA873_16085 [Desulfobulbaceae bacterium C00003063]|nr:MAG: hypothetical protein BA873_16085 [Desulfobulbaceae bacterium C00003063]